MSTVDMRTPSGGSAGSVDLDDALFAIEPNTAVMHQVVVAQLAARRAGTHSTKTRAEVRGGGRKPWRQKGTGNARQGSIRAPQWRGGGVAHGPKPRNYEQRTPKKMKRLALASALSDRAAEDKLIVVDAWGFTEPSTKKAVSALASLGVDGTVLVVLERDDLAAWKSFRNLPSVHLIETGQLNTYDVLVNDYLVFTAGSLPVAVTRGKRNKAAAEGDGAGSASRGPKKAARTAPVAPATAGVTGSSTSEADSDNPAGSALGFAGAPEADEAGSASASEADEAGSAGGDGAGDASGSAEGAEAPHGPGSAAVRPDGSMPEGYPIKGNADSMLYHVPESRWYEQTEAEVWFATTEAAEAAGFRAPGSARKAQEGEE